MNFGYPFRSLPRFLCLQNPNLMSTTMAPQKSILAKRQRSVSTSCVAPTPLEDPHRFISREAERIYHESLFNRSFVPERGFPTSNAFFNFIIQNSDWQTLCAPPVPGVAPVVWEFHSNFPFKVGTLFLFEASGSSLVPKPSTEFTACWMTTVWNIEHYLQTRIMSA